MKDLGKTAKQFPDHRADSSAKYRNLGHPDRRHQFRMDTFVQELISRYDSLPDEDFKKHIEAEIRANPQIRQEEVRGMIDVIFSRRLIERIDPAPNHQPPAKKPDFRRNNIALSQEQSDLAGRLVLLLAPSSPPGEARAFIREMLDRENFTPEVKQKLEEIVYGRWLIKHQAMK